MPGDVDRERCRERSDLAAGVCTSKTSEGALGMRALLRMCSVRRQEPGFEHRNRHVDLDVIREPVATEDLHESPLLKLDCFRDLGICIEEQEDLRVTGFQELSRLEERRRKGSLAADPHDAHTYPQTEDAGDQRLDECLVRVPLYEKGELDRRYGFRSSHRLYA